MRTVQCTSINTHKTHSSALEATVICCCLSDGIGWEIPFVLCAGSHSAFAQTYLVFLLSGHPGRYTQRPAYLNEKREGRFGHPYFAAQPSLISLWLFLSMDGYGSLAGQLAIYISRNTAQKDSQPGRFHSQVHIYTVITNKVVSHSSVTNDSSIAVICNEYKLYMDVDACDMYLRMEASCQVSHGLGHNLLLFVVRLSQITTPCSPVKFCHKADKSPVAIFSLVFHLGNKYK